MCHSSTPFTSPYNSIHFSVICFATGATFTYHHTLLVTPHIHLLSILFSFIFSLLLGFSLLPMSLHHMPILALPQFCIITLFSFTGTFLPHITPLPNLQFPHAALILWLIQISTPLSSSTTVLHINSFK